MIMALIVEDNREEAIELQKTLSELWDDLNFVICENGKDAVEYVEKPDRNIDIFFVDRDLPILSGFDFATRIRSMEQYVQTPIVFVTGFEMGQLDAFREYHCYSYILKPFKKETIKKHIGSLLDIMKKKDKAAELKRVISLSTTTGEAIICARDIIGLEVLGRYCYLYTAKGKYQLTRQPMKDVIEDIDYDNLVQCHKSFAINIEKVARLERVRRNIWAPVFKCKTDFKCEVSKTYHIKLIDKYREYLVEKI